MKPHRLAVITMFCVGLALAPARLPAQERIQAEAYTGTPFGVGRVTVTSGGGFRVVRVPRPGGGRIAELARQIAAQAGKGAGGETVHLESAEMALAEKSGRTFYPVFAKRDRPILRQFISVPTESTIFFLFQGDAPLDLTVYAPEARGGRIVPRRDPAAHANLLRAWWNDYSAAADGRDAPREYPQIVEEYLTSTLARRMNLPLPRRQQASALNFLRGELNMLFETETARLEIAEAVLSGNQRDEAATVALPEELPLPKPELLNPPEAAVEPIAMRVPVECLYVRFGNFPNFLWLRHRLEDWGGELRDVFSERGLDFGLNDRMQRQLGLSQGALAEVLGDKVIADVALIGTDTFMHEGSAIGTLFHAKSNTALSADLTNQRRTAMRERKATEEKLTIDGRPVSYMSTPDGSMRSYYVVDGDFHLVTTSRSLVEWFLGTSRGTHEALGDSEEFRYTRAAMPQERDDTVFVYLSPQFFQNLLGAHYQIELARRLRSAVEIQLFPIAQLAARAEGKPAATIDELVAGDLLPAGFGQHADGSRLELVDGRLVDSRRGARGSFVPVPDMTIDRITPAEAERYARFRQSYGDAWGAMDPLVVAIRREDLPEGKLERVVLDVRSAPLSAQHVQTLSNFLGDPSDVRLARVPGDVVALEAVVRGGGFFSGSGNEHRLFGALRNADPAIALDPSAGLIARIVQAQLQGMQGYVGAWPEPGLLNLVTALGDSRPDPGGYSRLFGGLWRREFDRYTLMSFHPEILEQVSPQLQFVKAPRPAQLWLRADDLANSTLAPLINAYGYRQSRQISAGNARFLNMLTEQLHVPAAECLATAERILNAKIMAPLGGKYELRAFEGGAQNWVATAVADRPENAPPSDYQFPALQWVRGADVELLLAKGPQPSLSLRGEFIMPVEHRAPAFQLPSLPFGKPKPKAPPAKPTPAKPKPEVLPAPKGREF
jgi:hypothetical protein